MSTNDVSKTGDVFDALVRKGRALFTREERIVVALKQAADQADLELKNSMVVAERAAAKVAPLRDAAAKARKAFEEAKAGLEKKK